MRINRFNPSVIQTKCQKNKTSQVSVSPAISPYLSMGDIPSVAFRGYLPNVSVERVVSPKILNQAREGQYSVKLFNKVKNSFVDAFITHGEPDEVSYGLNFSKVKTLNLYEDGGLKLGEVSISPVCEKDGSENSENLLGNYVRLPILESRFSDQYAGVGSTLFGAAVEDILQTDAKGKVYVLAANFKNEDNDPFVFYNKMGLSVVNPLGGFSELSEYIGAAAELLGVSRKVFRGLTQKIFGVDCSDYYISPDQKLLAIYETVAHHKSCRLDEIYLNFQENMYLHDDAVQKIWLPKIKTNPVFAQSNIDK